MHLVLRLQEASSRPFAPRSFLSHGRLQLFLRQLAAAASRPRTAGQSLAGVVAAVGQPDGPDP